MYVNLSQSNPYYKQPQYNTAPNDRVTRTAETALRYPSIKRARTNPYQNNPTSVLNSYSPEVISKMTHGEVINALRKIQHSLRANKQFVFDLYKTHEDTFRQLGERAKATVGKEPQDIADLLSALAMLNYKSTVIPYISSMAKSLEFTPTQAANCLWALGRLNVSNNDWPLDDRNINNLLTAAKAQIGDPSKLCNKDLADAYWGLTIVDSHYKRKGLGKSLDGLATEAKKRLDTQALRPIDVQKIYSCLLIHRQSEMTPEYCSKIKDRLPKSGFTVSQVQKFTAGFFISHGYTVEDEHEMYPEISFDMLVKGNNVYPTIVEYDGPHHFVHNRAYNGSSHLKDLIANARGARVFRIRAEDNPSGKVSEIITKMKEIWSKAHPLKESNSPDSTPLQPCKSSLLG